MTPERWQRITDVLNAAWDRDAPERGVFLDDACADDAALRAEVQALISADDRAEQFLAAPAAGARLGHYAIVGLIGEGGMGAVYRAVRTDDFRMQVAIKLMRADAALVGGLGHFQRERQILAGLEHPNIARLLDGGTTEAGLPYYVMEHVEGKLLLEYAADLPLRGRVELFRSICSAVQYAHERSVVHQDIKPANILVTPEGNPKLLDFGVAQLLEPAPREKPATAAVRALTPGYASPEQLRGEPVTAASDIYSLGVTLCQLVTGMRPPQPGGRFEKSGSLGRIPRDLVRIIFMALRTEPERRYASARQFSDDLGRFLDRRPTFAGGNGTARRCGKFMARNRTAILAAVVSASLTVVTTAVFGRISTARQEHGVEARSIAVVPFQTAGGGEPDYLGGGITGSPIDRPAPVSDLRVISRASATSVRGMPPPEMAKRLGVRPLCKVLELDEANGEAYAALAVAHSLFHFDRASAEPEFRLAIQWKRGDDQPRLWSAQHLASLGRFDEALAEFVVERKLHPGLDAFHSDPRFSVVFRSMGLAH